MEQQEAHIQGTGLREPKVQFAELSSPEEGTTAPDCLAEMPTEAVRRAAVIATLRVGNAEIDIYEGADATVVEALCKVVRHAERLHWSGPDIPGGGIHRSAEGY